MSIALGEESPRISSRTKKLAGALSIVLVLAGVFAIVLKPRPNLNVCVQTPSLVPSNKTFYPSSEFLDPRYVKKSAKLLGGAVKIPTESFDDMDIDPTNDKRFDIFHELHDYLEKKFPLTAKYRETVNTYGLLYTIKGSDKSLKPIVLMAHQDVVPVNPSTTDQWKYPPFSGHYDGEYLYGRGSVDTKNTLVAIHEAIEALLEQNWSPTRTVILSFGFDEEIEGVRGAKHLANVISERYGKHGVEVIFDEGFGMQTLEGQLFALPAPAEKGRIDFFIELLTPGGHGSMPPDHTGIGIMAELATSLENSPIPAYIEEGGVFAQMYNCIGRWAPDLSQSLQATYTNLHKSGNRKKLIKDTKKNGGSNQFMIRTSQAIDTILGGVKINALPEKTTMGIDYRIAPHQTLSDIKERLAAQISELADEYDLEVIFDGEHISSGSYGTFNISSHDPLPPAPISSTSGKVWDIVAGTCRHVFQDVVPYWKHETVVVAPSVLIGNTDTAWYWDVSKDIYRFVPGHLDDMLGLHTVNERLRFRSHVTAVIFFYEWVINWTTR